MAKIKLITTSLLLMLLFNQTKAQNGYAWDQLGNGINSGNGCENGEIIVLSKYINNNLYCLKTKNNTSSVIEIHKWNGSTWSQLPSISKPNGFYSISDIEEFNNELYFCGTIDYTDSLRRSGGKALNIIKFNGSSYDSLSSYLNTGTDSIIVTSLQVFNNKLYYVIESFSPKISSKLVSYDINGNTSLEFTKNGLYRFDKLKVSNNKLILAGSLDSVNGEKTSGMIYYDGTNFYGTKSKSYKNIWRIYKRNANQYVVLDDANKLEIWQGDSVLKDISNFGFQFYYYSGMTFYDKFIIPSYNQSIQAQYYDLDSNKWKTNNSLQNTWDYRAIPAGQNKAFMVSCSQFKGAAEIKLGAIVKGKLYVDLDSTCTFNAGDIILKNTLIEFDNGIKKYYTSSDQDGNFDISILAGNYNVTFKLPDIVATIAPCSTINITVVAGTTTTNLGVPIHLKTDKNLSVNISGGTGFRARLGFSETYYLTGQNYSVKNDSLILKLKYPSNIYFVSSDISPFSNSNNELIYKFSNVGFLESRLIKINFKSTVGVNNLNDLINFYAEVLNSTNDIKMDNNFDTLEQKIVGAYDPNIKESFPEGEITQNLNKIKYIIHFQNTGNDTAYKVTVVDSLTQRLGLRSLRVTGTSHPNSYSLRVENPGVLIWEFNNILLPDSHINEKASHGFIAFETSIDGNFAIGDKIDNKAYIYFDYQTPIITNVASVMRVEELNIDKINFTNNSDIKIYPNPSNGVVNFEIEKKLLNQKFEIFNQFGQLVYSSEFSENTKTIDMTNFANGFYVLKVENSDMAVKFLIMN